MVVSLTAAKAEGAEWRVNGVKITNALDVEGQAELDSPNVILLTKVGLSKIEISCTALKFTPHALLEESGSGKGRGGVEGCITKLNGTVAKACTPKSPGAPSGFVETNLVKAQIVGESTVELKPETGSTFVTLELGASCAIGNKIEITGKIFVIDCKNEGSVDLLIHLVEVGPSSSILFGANPATIDGSANVFLIGAHKGMKVSGVF